MAEIKKRDFRKLVKIVEDFYPSVEAVFLIGGKKKKKGNGWVGFSLGILLPEDLANRVRDEWEAFRRSENGGFLSYNLWENIDTQDVHLVNLRDFRSMKVAFWKAFLLKGQKYIYSKKDDAVMKWEAELESYIKEREKPLSQAEKETMLKAVKEKMQKAMDAMNEDACQYSLTTSPSAHLSNYMKNVEPIVKEFRAAYIDARQAGVFNDS